MAESVIAVTQGSGKNVHTFDRTISATLVQDQVVLNGEPYLASYQVSTGSGISAATAASHLIQIMAGASLRVYLSRLIMYQVGLATTASTTDMQLLRVTTAGTGGTAITAVTMDPADAAAGAAGMSLPSAKGVEGVGLWRGQVYFNQTLPTSLDSMEGLKILDLDFERMRIKPPIIAAGTTNGLVLKNNSGIAAATVAVIAYFREANF